MKRLFPPGLKTFLQNTPNTNVADLFCIQLSNGTVFYATDGQFDLTIPAGTPGWTAGQTTFRASQHGSWFRGEITSEAGTECKSNTMDLTCYALGSVNYPGTELSIYAAARNQLFDAATVTVFTAYMPIGQYGNVSNGVAVKFIGQIIKATPARGKIVFVVADPLYLLNQKIPSRLLQSACPWGFCDRNCALNPANFTTAFTIGGAPLTEPDGYFDQGVVTGLTGANAGLALTVKSYAGGVITTVGNWLLPVSGGDTFSVIKGCDKTPEMCAASVQIDGTVIDNYEANFGGTPFIPPPSLAI